VNGAAKANFCDEQIVMVAVMYFAASATLEPAFVAQGIACVLLPPNELTGDDR
jgi:hypothetical protein